MSDLNTNFILAYNIISYLYLKGVRDFCIAPGSRNASFSFALDALKLIVKDDINIHIHFDERALGFLGLGLSKASNKKVAIFTTSGSAVGNLFPSIMEAYMDNIPLIICSADRPYELIKTGSNQTCIQDNIFGTYAIFEHISPISKFITIENILNKIENTIIKNNISSIPIHLNIEFREPFYSDIDYSKQELKNILIKLKSYIIKNIVNFSNPCIDYKQFFKNSILIVGSLKKDEAYYLSKILQIIKQPTFLDIQSNLRFLTNKFDFIKPSSCISNNITNNKKKLIIIESKFIDKNIYDFISNYDGEVFFLSSKEHNTNSSAIFGKRIIINYKEIFKNICNYSNFHFIENNKTFNKAIDYTFSEKNIISLLPCAKEKSLFIGNSTICRFADVHIPTVYQSIYTNRGVSGIDGLIATACGIAKYESTLAIIGDTSALYDLSSISLLSKFTVKLLIINNNGGRIFNKFPIKNNQILSNFFINPHYYDFKNIAKMFSVKYININSIEKLNKILKMKIKKSIIIEFNF
ncbi:MAG: 2-succinyl-5-enolpyruvyl-6-hydroxy-3-cyclohexene-1-carboxylic-acid synthase [Succinivibrionaceae bacterium]